MSRKRKLFHENQTTTVEKYFVTDAVLDCAGNAGLVIIGKNVRNSIPKDIGILYLHKEKTNENMKHTNCCRT